MATQRIGNNRTTDGEVTGPKLGLNSIGANNFTSAANTYISSAATTNPAVVAAFNAANAAFASANTIDGVNVTQNTNITSANNTAVAAFLASNTATLLNDGVNTTQNASVAAAFTRANNSLNANSGGVVGGATTFSANVTINGDTAISGNLFVSGNTSKELSSPSPPDSSKAFIIAFVVIPFATPVSIINLDLLALINE